jgi:enterochelin esterase-like enzyme
MADFFELTSWGLVGVVAAVTAAVFLAAVVVIPRMRRRRLRTHLAQAVSLLLVSVLVLLSTGLLLNKQNNWFSSWADLFADPSAIGSVSSQVYGSTPAADVTPAEVSQQASELQAHPASNPDFGSHLDKDAQQGQYLSFSLPGSQSGQTYDVTLWLPASYLQHPDRFYPVILGFTGFPGSPDTYSESVDYGQKIEDAVAAGKMREAIMVIPDVFPGTYDSECVDGTKSHDGAETPRVETYVTRDLVPWVENNLRVINSPGAWSTEGYSAGGWCAAMLPLRHPDLFGSGMIQSGYFSPIYSEGQEWTDPKDPKYDLARIASTEKPAVNLHYFSSEADSLSWPSLEAFSGSVSPPTSLTADHVPAGGHTLDVWIPGMERGLDWLGSTSPYFAP